MFGLAIIIHNVHSDRLFESLSPKSHWTSKNFLDVQILGRPKKCQHFFFGRPWTSYLATGLNAMSGGLCACRVCVCGCVRGWTGGSGQAAWNVYAQGRVGLSGGWRVFVCVCMCVRRVVVQTTDQGWGFQGRPRTSKDVQRVPRSRSGKTYLSPGSRSDKTNLGP